MVEAYRVSTRRACGLVQCNRASFTTGGIRRDVRALRLRLRELAAARPRFGYRRLHILLRQEGWKTYRLYREEQLGVRVRRRKKRASQLRVIPAVPTRPNERWGMDFVADRLEDGRRIRILTIEDVFTRECLAVEVDTSLTSARVVEVLARITRKRGAPAIITVDNGSEFYSRTTDAWAYQQGVRLDFSRPQPGPHKAKSSTPKRSRNRGHDPPKNLLTTPGGRHRFQLLLLHTVCQSERRCVGYSPFPSHSGGR